MRGIYTAREWLLAKLGADMPTARARLGYNPGSLEQRASLPAGTIAAIEAGKNVDVTVPDLQRLLALLGLDDGGGPRQPPP